MGVVKEVGVPWILHVLFAGTTESPLGNVGELLQEFAGAPRLVNSSPGIVLSLAHTCAVVL